MKNTLNTLQFILLIYVSGFIFDIFSKNEEFVRCTFFITTIAFVLTLIKLIIQLKFGGEEDVNKRRKRTRY